MKLCDLNQQRRDFCWLVETRLRKALGAMTWAMVERYLLAAAHTRQGRQLCLDEEYVRGYMEWRKSCSHRRVARINAKANDLAEKCYSRDDRAAAAKLEAWTMER